MPLPVKVVQEDHRLEEQAEKSTTKLAELRWHWTLDEENENRVAIREYARDVSRSENAIRRSAKACAQYRAHPGISMADARVRAELSDDRLAVAQTIADARGLELETVQHKRRNEVGRVLALASEKAEKKGTSIAEEAPAVVAWIVKSETAVENVNKERAKKTDLRLIEVEGKALRMIRLGVEMLELLRVVEWDDEAIEFIEDSVSNLKAVVHLIDMSLAGAADIDWDAELAKITSDV